MHRTEMRPLSALVHSHSQQKPLLTLCFSTQVPSFFLSKASSAEGTALDHPALDVACRETLGDISVEVPGRTRTKPNGIRTNAQPAAVGGTSMSMMASGTAPHEVVTL